MRAASTDAQPRAGAASDPLGPREFAVPTGNPALIAHMLKRKKACCVLHLYSGPAHRIDGLKAMLNGFGIHCDEFDLQIDHERCDLMRTQVRRNIMHGIEAGIYDAAVMGTPCLSFSVLRQCSNDGGPGPLRDREHIEGLPDLPAIPGVPGV